MGQKRTFQLLARACAIVPWQGNDKLGEFAEPGLDVDPTAVLFDNDVVGHREAETGSFPGRFGGEEGIEHFRSHLGRDAAPVVANPDFDRFTQAPCDCAQNGIEGVIHHVGLACCRGIKPIGDQVQQRPGHLLRVEVEHAHVGIEIVLKSDRKARLFGPRAMIGEIETLFDKHVDIGSATLSGALARTPSYRVQPLN